MSENSKGSEAGGGTAAMGLVTKSRAALSRYEATRQEGT